MSKTIAHITDIHLQESFPQEQGVDQEANWTALLADLAKRKVDEVVFGGDIGEASSHSFFFNSLADYRLNLSLGNHDDFEEIGKTLSCDPEKDGLYKYEDGDHYRSILLDSSKEIISDKQFLWFSEAIQTDKKLLIFVHHPILPVPSFIDDRYALQGREKLSDLLLQNGNECTIFCGHYHMEDDRTEKNIRQLVTPAASYQLGKSQELVIENHEFGYRLVHVSPESINSTVIRLKSI